MATSLNLGERHFEESEFQVQLAGRPMAAVVPVWQLEERQKRQEKFFGMVEKAWEWNKKVRPEIIEREAEAAVRAVRAHPEAVQISNQAS